MSAKQRQYVAECAFAVICMAAGGTLYVIAPDFVRGWAFNIPGTTDITVSPSFFPRLMAIFVVAAGGLVILTMPLRAVDIPLLQTTWRQVLNALAGALGVLVYILAIPSVGFVVASTSFIVVASWLGGLRRPLLLLVTALFVSLALRAIFRFGLHVNLPTGLLI